jgi:hypothetical protein
MEVDADARAYDALSQHVRLTDLAAVTHASMTGAAEARRPEGRPERVAALATELKLSREDAATPFGNALDVLERGPEDDAERALACALAAHVVALRAPGDRDDEDRLATDLLWLATYTPFDATGLLDRALGDRAVTMWDAFADRVRRIDAGKMAAPGRGEALVAAVALASSRSKGASRQAAALARDVRDRRLGRVLAAGVGVEPVEPLVGEMTAPPRGAVATALMAMTGLLFALHALRLMGRLALAYKAPAELTLSDDGGLRVHWRVELLGRTLRARDVLLPRSGLMRATREVRYPRVALYGGLLALALGSYIGVSTFVDGVRAASPSLLAWGLAIVALGLALDFALSSIAPGVRGRCRLLLVPRDGAPLCIAGVDPRHADALLGALGASRSHLTPCRT